MERSIQDVTRAETYQHVVELLAGGWESDMIRLLSAEEVEQARADAAKLRARLLAEQEAKRRSRRRRPVVAEPEAQQALM